MGTEGMEGLASSAAKSSRIPSSLVARGPHVRWHRPLSSPANKTIPRRRHGAPCASISPASFLYGGSILPPGRYKGHDITIQGRLRGRRRATPPVRSPMPNSSKLKTTTPAPAPVACGGPVHRQHHGHRHGTHGPLAHGHPPPSRRSISARKTSLTRWRRTRPQMRHETTCAPRDIAHPQGV